MDIATTWWLLIPAVLLTATLSGVLGMGGGVLLMGVLASLLSAPAAILLHGLIQLTTNGFRALLLRRNVDVRFIFWFAGGTLFALSAFAAFAIVVDRQLLFIL